jgi:hypothetical protein
MTKPARSRRFVALIAAYVVALQALLLPLSGVTGAAAHFSLCTAAASHGVPQPARHDTSCPCAGGCGMQCCSSALAAPPQAVAVLIRAGVRITPAAAIVAVAPPSLHTPQLARAPPTA